MKKKYDIIWLEETDSTNNEAKIRFQTCDNLSVLTTLSQTHGRGQRGNTWTSEPGKNLIFSIILKFTEEHIRKVKAHDQFRISQIASVSVTDFLARHGIYAEIKWPNDIYVGCKKICGILIENSISGNSLSSSIIGIGLNINQRNFDVSLPNPTSLAIEKGDTYSVLDLKESLVEFMEMFYRYWFRYLCLSEEFETLEKPYLSRMWRKDSQHRFIDKKTGTEFLGTIRGISALGLLRIENEKGELNEFAFKEIEYII